MYRWGAIIGIALLLAQAGPAQGASQQDYADCNQTIDPTRSLTGCTFIIGDPATVVIDRVRAYIQRGNVYMATDKPGNAIGDYGEAVKIDPQNVLAYASQAIAYFRTGDRVHAIAAFRQAKELDPAKVSEMSAENAELRDIGAAAGQSDNAVNRVTPPPPAPVAATPVPVAPIPAAPVKVAISARKSWQATGLIAHGHGTIEFSVTGRWKFNAGLPAVDGAGDPRFSTNGREAYAFHQAGGREGQLIGRIGNGEPFIAGNRSRHKIRQGESGTVYLVINDDLRGVTGSGLRDNDGQLTVTLIEKPE